MPDLASWFADVPDRLRKPLLACADGALPANVALMQVLMHALDAREAEAELRRAQEKLLCSAAASRIGAALDLLRRNPQAWATVKTVLRDVEHDRTSATPEDEIARCAAAFDRAARTAPEAGVALYALGNTELLETATAEVVAQLRGWGVLGADRTVLDLGCGIGRLAKALAPEIKQLVGIDISGEMIKAARQRCTGLVNVRFQQSSGRDLSAFADDDFDIVLAVDCLPYIAQAGMSLVERYFAEAARVLKRGGDLVIINFSYRDDPDGDRADVERLARACAFHIVRNGTRDFTLWDGVTFHLVNGDERARV